MRLPTRRRPLLVAVLVAGLLAACEDGGTAPVIPPPAASPVGGWYLHEVDDSAVSAVAADRLVGVAREVTVVDSAVLTIYADGTFEQRRFNRVLLQDQLDRLEIVVDQGTWSAALNAYTFASTQRPRTFIVTLGSGDRLLTAEPFATYVDAPTNDGVYRRTRP